MIPNEELGLVFLLRREDMRYVWGEVPDSMYLGGISFLVCEPFICISMN